MYPIDMTGMGWSMTIWSVLSVVLIALVVVAIIRVITPAWQARDDARRILDERFARGEIEPQEYRERRTLIG